MKSTKPVENARNKNIVSPRLYRPLAYVATLLAIIALLLGTSSFTKSAEAEKLAKWCAAQQKTGPTGAAGASAYTIWLSVGNKGSLQDFLDSLVGEKGPTGYVGSTGFNGADGKDGKDGKPGPSAYQLWLDAGNQGTSKQFLTSLIGSGGTNGTDGTDGTDGSNGTDGADGTDGTDGVNGVDGAAGLSAYELWVSLGNSGTETDFLNSLVGKAGADGSDGVDGSAGKSAYEIWLDAGNSGTEIDFLASLQGATGSCTPGSGLGYFGSFLDTTTQTNNSSVNLMTFNVSDANNDGVTIQNGSRITFANPGTYNIQFSAQVNRLSGGNETDLDIWFKQNGANIPNSNSAVTVQSNAHKVVPSWNIFVTTTNTNEYVEIAWSSPEPTIQLLSRPSNSYPAIPSVILTVNQVD
jgi:hypothetical protein